MKWTPSREELRLRIAEHEAGEAWIEWCRQAVRPGVRFDLDPRVLMALPTFKQCALGVGVWCPGRVEPANSTTTNPGASDEVSE
jgi:hypothetical protein